ncbi:MAG: dTMP kinase [Acidobacteriota bacterium]
MARFITFEGLDGSGKTTQLNKTLEWLAAHRIDHVATREPGGTPLGDRVRDLFLASHWGQLDGVVEALLVFASRRQHLLEVIEPALATGRHVICDRFTDSTRAYQGGGRGVDATWIEELDGLVTGGRMPDHTLLFDLPGESARERATGGDRLDAEALAFYERVRAGFLDVARRDPERVVVIDATADIETTWRRVEAHLRAWFDLS